MGILIDFLIAEMGHQSVNTKAHRLEDIDQFQLFNRGIKTYRRNDVGAVPDRPGTGPPANI